MFIRGNSPLVSVLIPSRNKSQSLLEAIDSIYSLAFDKGNVEFLVKADNDDIKTIETICSLQEVIPLKAIISPRGKGYLDIHHWINDLSRIARGDWLYLFNDDARIKTEGWDQILLQMVLEDARPGTEDVCLVVTPTLDRPTAKEFMFLRRTAFHILDHWSLSPFVDYWIRTVAIRAGVCFQLPIWVEHLNTGGNSFDGGDTVSSIDALREIIYDQLKIIAYLEREIKKTEWNPEKYYLSCVGGLDEIS